MPDRRHPVFYRGNNTHTPSSPRQTHANRPPEPAPPANGNLKPTAILHQTPLSCSWQSSERHNPPKTMHEHHNQKQGISERNGKPGKTARHHRLARCGSLSQTSGKLLQKSDGHVAILDTLHPLIRNLPPHPGQRTVNRPRRIRIPTKIQNRLHPALEIPLMMQQRIKTHRNRMIHIPRHPLPQPQRTSELLHGITLPSTHAHRLHQPLPIGILTANGGPILKGR